MSAPTRQQKRLAMARLGRLNDAAEQAADDVLVAIHQALEAGILPQAAIAAAIGGVSPSTIRGKAARGAKILEERKQ
ncbi:hypothetical protein [Streptomyces paludis]|uniref:Uncharacterized protein n=1 Tax=Streptomyces paludis TaxID=2282738 RepID=A0A345HWU3_9ACTN|nr:hypothetical protein [Streptomyces paludis]AXG81167.1 hypothetical protein DVK44_29645 [Streptomyces paludis]